MDGSKLFVLSIYMNVILLLISKIKQCLLVWR